MKLSKATDSKGNIIGNFDGTFVKNKNGDVLFRIDDGEVYQPTAYSEKDLQSMNKGQQICVGVFTNNDAVSNEGDLLFKVS